MEANKNLAEMETAKETAETNYSSIKNDYDEIIRKLNLSDCLVDKIDASTIFK